MFIRIYRSNIQLFEHTSLYLLMVSVDVAIKKGRIQLFWIPLSIMLGFIILVILAISVIKNGSIWIPICGFGGFLLAFTLPFLHFFLVLPRWRIWAFSNVRNVHELKQSAILGQIYPKDGSFLWRFEIKTIEQKQQIVELDQKFDIPDVFVEDYEIPFETSYSYSKIENVFYVLFTIGAALGGTALLLQREYLISILLLLGGAMFGTMAYKRLSAGGSVLVISNDGITTKENGFHAWCDIKYEQIFFVSAGEASYYGLSYEVNGELIKMSLKELTGLSSYKMDHVLRTYRGRHQYQNRIKQ